MSSPTTISPDKLARLIGTANTPVLIDVRTDEDFAADPRLIPGAIRRSHEDAADWGKEFSGRSAVVVCLRGQKLAQGTAAWLRHVDVEAEALEGGFEGWKAAKLPLVPASKLPRARRAGPHRLGHPRAAEDRPHRLPLADPALRRSGTRCSCSWRRPRWSAVGERFNAVPFDIENVFWSHRGELCTFDVMVEEFGLATPALLRLATMVRAADTARLDLVAGSARAAGGIARPVADV